LQPKTGLLVHPPRGRKLRGTDVHADDASRAASLEPRADVGGSAAELDDVFAANIWQDVELGLRRIPDAPSDLGLVPRQLFPRIRVLGVGLGPVRAIRRHIVGI